MNGSKTNMMTKTEVLAAVRSITSERDFIWDGMDEDERPASDDELQAALNCEQSFEKDKTQIALQIDNKVLNAFKLTGKGWQTRMNDALKDWLNQHPDFSRV